MSTSSPESMFLFLVSCDQKPSALGKLKEKQNLKMLVLVWFVLMHSTSLMVPGGVKRVKAVANSELHSNFPKRNGFFGVKQKNHSLWEGYWIRVGVYSNWLKAGIKYWNPSLLFCMHMISKTMLFVMFKTKAMFETVAKHSSVLRIL